MTLVNDGLRRLFRRCVRCEPGAPQCPVLCPEGQICSLVPQDCDTCAHMTCITDPSPPPVSSGPNVGAIAGGVAGGIAFVAFIVFFIWLFWIKKRRAQQDKELEEEWEQDEIMHQKRSLQLSGVQQDVASTRTRGSLANSILSRASNFIQIAYIPGVTNRNGSSRTSLHAPVPPVPAAYRDQQSKPKSPLSNEGDALFFGIDDLRGSTYSGASSARNTRYTNNRDTRYTVNSITPSLARDSVASDVQWDSANTAPMTAATVARIAPRMVSVKSGTSSTKSPTPDSGSNPSTPPEHIADQIKEVPVMIPGQGSSPTTSLRVKPTQVTVASKKVKGRFPVRQTSDASSTTTPSIKQHAPLIPSPLAETEAEAEPDGEASAGPQLINISDSTTLPYIQPSDSPFFDASDLPSAAISAASSTRPNPYASMASTIGVAQDRRLSTKRGSSKGKIGSLSAVIEEATKRASTSSPDAKTKDPFDDENAVER